MSDQKDFLWLLYLGSNPLLAKTVFAESMGVSRQFLNDLQTYHDAPQDILLPGKPTETSDTGRGRQMVWQPAWYEFFFKLAQQQGVGLGNNLIFPFSPDPGLLGQLAENIELTGRKPPLTFDDGGTRDV
jgi:hypothetical protein